MKRKISLVLIMTMLINLVSAFGAILPMQTAVVGYATEIDPNGKYVTTTGAGNMDGSDWDNAMQGDMVGGLQAAWDITPENGTLYVGSGTYTTIQSLNINKNNDGIDKDNMKRLVGVDTGAGKPRFVGRYKLGDVGTSTNADKLISLTYSTATPVPTAIPIPSVSIYNPGSLNDETAIVKYANAFIYAADVATDVLISNPNGATSIVVYGSGVTPDPTAVPTATPTPEPTATPDPNATATPEPNYKAILMSLITEAQAIYDMAIQNVGTQVGQYEAADVAALAAAIASVQAVYDNPAATTTEITDAIAALRAAMAACVPITPSPTPTPTATPIPTPLVLTFDSSAYVASKNAYSLTKMLGNAVRKASSGTSVKYRFETVGAGTYNFSLQVVHGVGTVDPITGAIAYDSVLAWDTVSNVLDFTLSDAAKPYTIPEGATVLFEDDFQGASYQLVNPDKAALPTAKAELVANGWTCHATDGQYGIAQLGSNKFLKITKVSSTSNIEKSFNQPIQINANPAPAGVTPLVANGNGKLVFEYDFKPTGTDGGKSFNIGLRADTSQSTKYITQLAHTVGTNLPLTYVQEGTTALTLIPQFDRGLWYKVKQVINIKDAAGNYVSTVDTYLNGQPVKLGTRITASDPKLASVAGKFYITTNLWAAALTYAGDGVGVDNIRAYYIEEASTTATEAPQPTLKPTPVPTIGPAFVPTGAGASFVEISNLQIDNYFYNIYASGKNRGLKVNNILSHNSSDVCYFKGGSNSYDIAGSEDILVEDCQIFYQAKRGVRFCYGVDGATVKNVVCDAGGYAYWATGNWPCGFTVEGNGGKNDQNINFIDCVSQNNWEQGNGTSGEYWNSDGIAVERDVNNITYLRCYMAGSTDGGIDDKSSNPIYTDCINMNNKKNYRVWSTNATMINCFSGYSELRGGTGGSTGLWTNGKIDIYNSTFYNNGGTQIGPDVEGGTIYAKDCIFSVDNVGGSLFGSSGTTTLEDCIIYDKNKGIGTDPQIYNPSPEYVTAPTSKFNSLLYGPTKGFWYADKDEVFPTAAPTPTPTVGPTADPLGNVTTVIVNDNFESYANVSEITGGGWAISGAPLLSTTASPKNDKYVNTPSGSSLSKTFAPIPIKSTGGASPGKNAKVVFEFDMNMSGGSGGSTGYMSIKEGASDSAITYARRATRSSRLDYGSVGSDATANIITSSLAKFTRIRTEIDITDANGYFLAGGPKVSMWVNGQPALANMGILSSTAKYIDTFSMGSTNFSMDIDNFSVKVITNDTIVPIQRTITAAVDSGNGTISSTSAVINDGAGKTFNIKPTTGNAIDYIKVNGVMIDKTLAKQYTSGATPLGFQFTLANVTQDTTLNVKFYNTTSETAGPTVAPTATPTATPVSVPNKTALGSKIIEAQNRYQLANAHAGTAVGQYSAAVISALWAAISVAQGVYDNASAVQADVDTAATNLNAVIIITIVNTATPTPTPTPTPAPVPTIPDANKVINGNGTITNPYGKVDASLVRVDVSGIIDPTVDSFVVMVKGTAAKYTNYNGVYKFVALVDGSVSVADITVAAGTPERLIYADVNANGVADSTDVNLLKGAVAGNRVAANYFELIASDVTGDGAVNSSDYNALKGFIAGNLAILPVYSK